MADNLTTSTAVATIPTGTIIATDDISSVHYQRVKTMFGADGTATAPDLSPGTGGSGTQRVAIDTSQIESVYTTVQSMAVGYHLVALPSDALAQVSPQPQSAGGLTIFRSLDLDETEEDVKTSAGLVYALWVTNTAASTRFVKFFDSVAASVTVGTTTPVITIGIPGNSADDISGAFAAGGHGIGFTRAICVAATTDSGDAQSGAPGTGDLIVNIFYK